MPKVSICLPNLNCRAFLAERLATIFAQTVQDWEIVVSDNYSEDGAWEFFQSEAQHDARIRITQTPREGMYANWNRCIQLAQGEYIYMATSDDTMPPDCLEKLVLALETHPECDIAHCPLRVIDIEGEELDFAWDRVSVFARSSQNLLDRPHVRNAPYDGLLCLGGETVYNSFTQLLIRRSLFDRVGFFCGQWGSVGDFNWGMRAGLIANTIHVPNTWGGWRVHPDQATNPHAGRSMAHRRKVEEMIEHAIETSRPQLPGRLDAFLHSRFRTYFLKRWEFDELRSQQGGRSGRARLLLGGLARGSSVAWSYLGRRLKGSHGWPLPPIEVVASWCDQLGFPALEKADNA